MYVCIWGWTGEEPAKEPEKEGAMKWKKKQESEYRRQRGMRNARVICLPQEGGKGVNFPGAQGGRSSWALEVDSSIVSPASFSELVV